MFEINNLNFKKLNSTLPIYTMNNFYKNPDEVLFYLNDNPPYPHKWSFNTNNLNYFSDLRHNFNHEDLTKVTKELITYFKILNKKPNTKVLTNIFRMNCLNFNNFNDNYWAPHYDDVDGEEMTFLIYFNLNGCDGTNFYNLKQPLQTSSREHDRPWHSKTYYDLILNVKSKYNMCLAFNSNILHGMAINSNRFFSEFRVNQAIFI